MKCARPLLLLLLLLLGGANAERLYRVKSGDTFWSLARTNDTSVQVLLSLNGRSRATLRSGEIIRLPGGTSRFTQHAPVYQRGYAVYYPGRRDSRTVMTAAHLSLPKGTWVRVTHARTGRSVDVLINDRGPFGVPSRIIDLSDDAARVLGILREGVAPVTLQVLSRR